jgi:profilin
MLVLMTPSLVGTGHVDKAAIFDSTGASVWATSPNFSITPTEMQTVVGAFKDTGNPKKVQMEGIHIAGQKYFVLKADDGSIYGKQVRPFSTIIGCENGEIMSRLGRRRHT